MNIREQIISIQNQYYSKNTKNRIFKKWISISTNYFNQ